MSKKASAFLCSCHLPIVYIFPSSGIDIYYLFIYDLCKDIVIISSPLNRIGALLLNNWFEGRWKNSIVV
jgi:hypothetical protein